MSLMEGASVYIPMDRRQALAHGRRCPSSVQGAALFADISGFTPLTEALAAELGPQRGAEELARHLNPVYDALIAELERYGGSVIGFSGDAITCWLDGDDGAAGRRPARWPCSRPCASSRPCARPRAGQVTLAVKVAVATGPARRFLVGDPTIQVIDVLAGATLDRLAAAEHLREAARWCSTLLRRCIGRRACVPSRRYGGDAGDRPALTAWSRGLRVRRARHSPGRRCRPGRSARSSAAPGCCRPVYERLQAGLGEFLAELRPAVALFLRFGGIDYDARRRGGRKARRYIRQVQRILGRYDGTLIQLTMGDKGSYLYAAFGAPVAHEDDAVRAAAAALELRS